MCERNVARLRVAEDRRLRLDSYSKSIFGSSLFLSDNVNFIEENCFAYGQCGWGGGVVLVQFSHRLSYRSVICIVPDVGKRKPSEIDKHWQMKIDAT